ncbi:MAG: DUF5926 family protein [Austwickia sp.]|nr:DUF5926 family protein [Actinomycetota bacterium]MCB1254653.1 topoisomerase II [Austwickia sp.]MCO5307943.1 DUF5926 family protein [Austwickia sp.]
MGKASRRKRQAQVAQDTQVALGAQGAQGTRGTRGTKAIPAPYVARPFHGLPAESDWVAMREIVPAATATLAIRPDAPGVPADAPAEVTVATVLPMAWPGMRRADGAALVALQTVQSGGDPSRDVAQALLAVLAAEPGTPVAGLPPATAQTPRLQDLIAPDGDLAVTVHDDFGFWIAPDTTLEGEAKASLEEANAAIIPTTKMAAADSAYWCRVGERTHLRWILPHDEDAAIDALARLHAAGTDSLGEHTRLLGAFRAGGLLCPVWDLDPARTAGDYEDPLATLAAALTAALTDAPLTSQERRAKNGLLSRQLTLR